MSENPNSNTKIESQEAPNGVLSELIKKLGISDNIAKEINNLSQEKKEELEFSLKSILKEVEDQKLGPTDRDQKIKNTLASEYGIISSEEVTTEKGNISNGEERGEIGQKILNKKFETIGNKYEKLQKNLESVKKLDPTIVGEELANAKATNPLPNEVKITIAKSSNSTPEQVDEAIKSGNNPQISNLIDSYYLTNPNVQTAIEKRLPETKLKEANIAFQELRANVRDDFPGILSPFTPKDLPSRLSDKSDATQGKVIETVNSLTKGAPDTVITRDGDRLSWEDKKGSKYEIDMAVRPPKLTKSLGSLYLSRTEHEENPEVKILQQDIESGKKELNTSKTEIGKTLDNSGVYGFNPDNYTPDELRQLFSGVDISSFEQKLNDAKTTEQQTTLKEELKNNREGSGGKLNKVALQYMEYILDERIQIGNSGIEGASSDTVSSKDWMEKLTSLKELKSSKKIEEYATEKEELQKKEKKLGEIKSPSVEEFDEGSDTVLKKLNSLGLDKIGQKNLDALIQGLAARDNGVGIWKSGGIDMDDTVVRENQIKDLEQVASQLQTERRNNSKTKDDNSLGNVFGDISNMIKGNDSFRNLWNSPVGLSLWLKRQGTQDASPKTETPKNNPV